MLNCVPWQLSFTCPQELVGDIAEVMELVEGAFSGVLERYPDMEMTFLRLQYYNMPNMARIFPIQHYRLL